LIGVAGPTASGKSAAAVALCRIIYGEIVSVDSMQLYRGMDIGTAKPTAGEMGRVAHHLIDVAEPDEHWSAARYREAANEAIAAIYARGRQPVLCGGTGLYFNAITKPMSFAAQEGDIGIRNELQMIADESDGKIKLHGLLKQIDPEAAGRLHPNDVRRVIRAIEVYRLTGQTITERAALDAEREGAYDLTLFGLAWPRDALYARIDERVDQMMARGLVDEVKRLMERTPGGEGTALQALGYKEIAAALRGACSIQEAVDAVKQGTRQYAKRQYTWFRRDSRVHWIQAENRTGEDIAREMLEEINRI